jgi:hypothetical protein
MIDIHHLVRVAFACMTIAALPHDAARAAQLLPTPQDGDIRTVYWELQNRSEVFLTLQLKTLDGKIAPLVTITVEFPGKTPNARPSSVLIHAYAGTFWAPRAQFWLLLDDAPDKIDLVPKGWIGGLVTGPATDYLPVTISLATLNEIADARRVSGNVLGFDFALSDSQRQALRAFRDRVMGM